MRAVLGAVVIGCVLVDQHWQLTSVHCAASVVHCLTVSQKKKILVSFFSCRQLVNILTLGLRLQKQVVVWAVLVVVGREDGRPVRLCWSGVDKINCSSGGVGVGGGGGVGGGETATAVDVLVDNPPLSLSHGSPTAGERRSPFSKQEKRTKRKGIACLVLNGLARWRHCAVF